MKIKMGRLLEQAEKDSCCRNPPVDLDQRWGDTRATFKWYCGACKSTTNKSRVMSERDGGIGNDVADETAGVSDSSAGSNLPVHIPFLSTIQKDEWSVRGSDQWTGHLEDPLSIRISSRIESKSASWKSHGTTRAVHTGTEGQTR